MGEAALNDYVKKIGEYYQKGKATEHTYRGTLQQLIENLEAGVSATNEPKRIKCGAPDYLVERSNLTVGYVEAKDIGISLDQVEKSDQLKRYLRALDNLILTDYLEFRWYVQGEKRMTARIGTISNKKIILDKNGVKLGEELLRYFVEHRGEQIRKPEELAKRMARLAHMIRDIIVDAFKEKIVSSSIQDLYEAFQNLLLPDLTEEGFADMFTQTIAYGLFAARYNHKGKKPFSREDAAKEIPKTNPFLRRLFGTIAGPDLEEEPFIGFVNELAQILAFTDMDAVLADFGKRTRQEDPIVHFYETFLAQYDPKLREMRGVYYTPEPVVSYIVRSVDHLLREHFDCAEGLADTTPVLYSYKDKDGNEQITTTPRVVILDPATGTGTFLYNVIAHIRESYRQMGNAGMWSSYVREQLLPRLFGFELLMASYAMAHLKLGMQLAALDLPPAERKTWAYDFESDERLGIYLTNTLDEALKRSGILFGKYISDEANEAAKVKQGYPVMVVLGNPPYSGHSANKGRWINELMRGIDSQTGRTTGNYFEVDGRPLGERNSKWLNDDYVKFIRFAQWRIEQTGYGILAFITNHGYLENPTFRGMRQSLMQSFDDIYLLDLHGNSKKKEKALDGSKDENVFDIQQGVAIGIFVKRQKKGHTSKVANVYHAHLRGPREVYEKVGKSYQRLIDGKYYWLAENDVNSTEWVKLEPQQPYYLFAPQNISLRDEYETGVKLTELMPINVLGFQTHRDHFAIDLDENRLLSRISEMRESNLSDADFSEKYGFSNSGGALTKSRRMLRQNHEWQKYFTQCFYRPFDKRFCYYSEVAMDRPRKELRQHMLQPNFSLNTTRQTKALQWRHAIVANTPTPALFTEIKDGSNAFPLYLYPDTRPNIFDSEFTSDAPGGRRPNLASTFTKTFSSQLRMCFVQDGKGDLQHTFGPEDIFNYMYSIFHSPTYRERYAEFLKIDFPRLPLTSNAELFRELCKLGQRLVELHLMEKFGKRAVKFPAQGNNIIEKVSYTCDPKEPERARVWINKEQYIEGVSPEVWEFHVGGYQVCEKWLKDRKGREFGINEFYHYQRIIAALAETISLMAQVDQTIEAHGGWPLQ